MQTVVFCVVILTGSPGGPFSPVLPGGPALPCNTHTHTHTHTHSKYICDSYTCSDIIKSDYTLFSLKNDTDQMRSLQYHVRSCFPHLFYSSKLILDDNDCLICVF